jgi:hypothetical protein
LPLLYSFTLEYAIRREWKWVWQISFSHVLFC